MRPLLFALALVIATASSASAGTDPSRTLAVESVEAEGNLWVLELRQGGSNAEEIALSRRSRFGKEEPAFWNESVRTVYDAFLDLHWRAAFALNPSGSSAWVAVLSSTREFLRIDLDFVVPGGPHTWTRTFHLSPMGTKSCDPEYFSVVAQGDEAFVAFSCDGKERWLGYSRHDAAWFELAPTRWEVAGQVTNRVRWEGKWPLTEEVPTDYLPEERDDQFRWNERLAKIAFAHPRVQARLARFFLLRGEVDRAVAEYSLHLKYSPSFGEKSRAENARFAERLRTLGRIAEAEEILHTALERKPADPGFGRFEEGTLEYAPWIEAKPFVGRPPRNLEPESPRQENTAAAVRARTLAAEAIDAEGNQWVLESREGGPKGPDFAISLRSRSGENALAFWSRQADTGATWPLERAAFARNPGGGSAWVAFLTSTNGHLTLDLDLVVPGGPLTEPRRIEISRADANICEPEQFSVVAAREEAILHLVCDGHARWIGYSEPDGTWFELAPTRWDAVGQTTVEKQWNGVAHDFDAVLFDSIPEEGVPPFPWSDRLSKIAFEDPQVQGRLARFFLDRGEVDRAVAEIALHLKYSPYQGRESRRENAGFAERLLALGRIENAANVVAKTLDLATGESPEDRCNWVAPFAHGPLAEMPVLGEKIRDLLPFCTTPGLPPS